MRLITTLSIMGVASVLLCVTTSFAQVRITSTDISTRNINRLQLTNTPVADAIRLVAELGRVPVYLDKESISDAGIPLQTPVTATLHDSSIQQILQTILPAELAFATQDGAIVIASKTRVDSGQPFNLETGLGKEPEEQPASKIIEVGQAAVEQQLARTMPVHFDHMPLEGAVQMLAGFAGKHVQFDRSAERFRFAMVTLHRNDATIRKNLDDILSEAGLTWKISGHTMSIGRTK